MATERPDAGRLLDRRKFLKGSAALAALAAAAAAGTPALARGNRLKELVRDWAELANRIVDFVAAHGVREGSFTPEVAVLIRRVLEDFLRELTREVLKRDDRGRAGLRREDIENDLEYTLDVMGAFLDELRVRARGEPDRGRSGRPYGDLARNRSFLERVESVGRLERRRWPGRRTGGAG
jgi:hypothetical protein